MLSSRILRTTVRQSEQRRTHFSAELGFEYPPAYTVAPHQTSGIFHMTPAPPSI
jgi:hypothetical protein